LTGCTFGKGNLIHLDYGKNAFTFFRRSDGKAVRITARREGWGEEELAKEHQALREKINSGGANDAERARFKEVHQARALAILERPLEQMFVVTPVEAVIPAHARVHASVTCTGCGEQVMETRARIFMGEEYCIPCFEARDRR
jgi:formylmethanofuran dehydrogenase subunit E